MAGGDGNGGNGGGDTTVAATPVDSPSRSRTGHLSRSHHSAVKGAGGNSRPLLLPVAFFAKDSGVDGDKGRESSRSSDDEEGGAQAGVGVGAEAGPGAGVKLDDSGWADGGGEGEGMLAPSPPQSPVESSPRNSGEVD